MRHILAALVAVGSLGFATPMPASADIYVQTPGVAVVPADPYWREHSDWRARREFREEQYRHEAWLRSHCVRDWSGQEFCRR